MLQLRARLEPKFIGQERPDDEFRIELSPRQLRSSDTGSAHRKPMSFVTTPPTLDVVVPTKAAVRASKSICDAAVAGA